MNKGRSGEGLYIADGKWTFKYKDAKGSWKTKSTGFDGDNKLKAKAFSFKEDFLKVKNAPPAQAALPAQPVSTPKQINPLQTRTLAVAGRWFLGYLRASNKSKSTVTGARYGLDRLMEVFGKKKVLNTFTLFDLDRYVATRRAKPSESTGQPVGPHLVNLELRMLRQILGKAALWKLIDPDEEYQPLPEPSEKVGQVLSEDQLKRLIALSDKVDRWYVAFYASLLAYSTGCRGVEIKRLKIKHIHLDAPVPYIEVSAKTPAGHRTIPLTAVAQWALRKLLERAEHLGAVEDEHFLLPLNRSKCNYSKDPRKAQRGYDPTEHQSTWRTAWRSLKKAAGLPRDFRFHDLRCCAISNMAMAGVPKEVRLSISGHTSEAMNRHYTFILENAKANAVKAIEGQHAGLFASLTSTGETAAQ